MQKIEQRTLFGLIERQDNYHNDACCTKRQLKISKEKFYAFAGRILAMGLF
jgi:hypothetical protein